MGAMNVWPNKRTEVARNLVQGCAMVAVQIVRYRCLVVARVIAPMK